MGNSRNKNMKWFIFLFVFALGVFFINDQSQIKAKESGTVTSSTITTENSSSSTESEQNTSINSGGEVGENQSKSKAEEKTTTSAENNGIQKFTLTDSVTTVSNWNEFVTAFRDNTVTDILFLNDIAYGVGGTTSIPTNARTDSLTIDGGNFKLTMGSQILYLNATKTATLTVKNISEVKQNDIGTRYGFVYANLDFSSQHSGWTLNFGNLYKGATSGWAPRLACNSGGQINIIDDVTWYTSSELVTTSGMKIEDGVKLTSYKNNYSENRSFIWFDLNNNLRTSLDVGSNDFIVGKNASANFRMTNTGATAYPVVFSFFKNFILEEGATFNGTMPGNAYRADYQASNFIAKGKNKINLTSLSNGYAPIAIDRRIDRGTSSSDATTERQFYVGPESELYVIAATGTPLFATSGTGGYAIGNTVNVTIDSPKYLDLRNYSTSTTSANSSILNSEVKNFSILNSDINIWRLADNVNSQAPYAFSTVESLTQSGVGNSLVSTSSDSGVANLLPLNKIRRISALNENPKINFIDVTNAQKYINYETILGYFPDKNGMDMNGIIHYDPVYPNVGQATADITDTYGTKHLSISSGANGQNKLATGQLNKAGEYTLGTAYFGKRIQDEQTTYKVWDVVPPDPAVVTSSDLTEGISSLEGTGEIGATVYLDIDGTRIDSSTTTVGADGKWKVTFDKSLAKTNGVATIYLEDHAGKADITTPPATNNTNGNINPKNDLTYQDVTFKAATKVTFVKSSFKVDANDFTMNAKDYPKTDSELDALILEKSEAILTNLDTGKTLPASNLTVDKSKLPSTSSSTIDKGDYQVELSFTRGESTFTKKITITIIKNTIVDPGDGVTPFVPQNEDTGTDSPINEGNDRLQIQYASNFDFGAANRNLINSKNILSSSDYGTPEGGTVKKVPNFISVNDERKTPTGWNLTVSTTDFVQKDNGSILKGAYMTLSNFKYNGTATQKPNVSDKAIEISENQSTVSSDKTGMNGSWSLSLGDLTSGDKSSGVNLTVPKNAAGSLGEYSTNIVWTLTPEITP